MEYFDFIDHVREAMVTEFGQSKKVRIGKVIKNNDVELDSLSVFAEDESVTPTVYLNDYYKDYMKGRTMEEILYEISYIFGNHYERLEFDVDKFTDFEAIKDRIAYKLVNKKLNERFLKDVPHVEFLDLAIVFYYMLDTKNNGDAIAVIHNTHLKLWGIEERRLYEESVKNTPKLLPYTLMPMGDVLKALMAEKDIPEELLYDIDSSMYVLSNEHKFFGASSLLYKDLLRDIANRFGRNLYILPSSVHEVIIIPDYGKSTKSEYSEIVRDINEHELLDTEILGNNAYYYILNENKLIV